MKRKSLIYCVMFLITSMFYSCNKNSDGIIQDQNLINGNEVLLIPTTATLVDEKSVVQSEDSEVVEAEEFAKLLASAINGKEVRKFIKDEANKKFDGDFDILVSKVLDSKIGQINFKEKVEQNSSFGASKGKEVFEKAIRNPKLNISVPIQIENWNESKQQLLVAVNVGTIDGETKFLKAFDSKGREYLIDANIEPNVPVIVVGNNERMGYQVDAENDKSARISGNYEWVTYAECYDLNAIEAWSRGCPEIKFDAIVYMNGAACNASTNKITEPSSRDAAEAGWNPNLRLFQWNFASSMGDAYFVSAIELDDNGITIKIPFTVSGKIDSVGFTAGIELTYKEGDDLLPGELISYNANSPNSIWDDRIIYQMTSKSY